MNTEAALFINVGSKIRWHVNIITHKKATAISFDTIIVSFYIINGD